MADRFQYDLWMIRYTLEDFSQYSDLNWLDLESEINHIWRGSYVPNTKS